MKKDMTNKEFSKAFKKIMLGMLNDIGTAEERNVGTDKVDGFIIDTSFTSDEGFETGICTPKGKCCIVERYKNQEEAMKGHEEWCGKIRNGERKVTSLFMSDFPQYNEEVVLE